MPAIYDGAYLRDVPKSLFIDTGEDRMVKAGRVFSESIGGINGVAQDLANIALFPVREPLLFGVGAVGVGVLIANDYQFTSYYQDRVEPAFDWVSLPRLFDTTGTFLTNISTEDKWLLAGIGSTYAIGMLANDERAQATAILAAKATTYSYVVSHLLLKPVFGRYRPIANLSSYGAGSNVSTPNGFSSNPYIWRQGGGIRFAARGKGTAFPSFHYTLNFAVARVYSGMYDNSVLPYVVAGLLSVSNIRGHQHWVSDMAAGALIGTVIGQSVLNSYADRKSGLSTSFMPTYSSRGVGAQFSMQF